MEVINALGSIIVSFIAGIFATPYIFNRGIKKIKMAQEAKDLLNDPDLTFRNAFIRFDLQESYFLAQTGIDTSAKAIPLYIAFRNKIGIDCKWSTIRSIRPYLHFTDTEIQIRLEKLHAVIANIVFVFGLTLCISGIGLFAFYYQNLQPVRLGDFMLFIYIMIALLFAGLFLIRLVRSTIIARAIQRKIDKSK